MSNPLTHLFNMLRGIALNCGLYGTDQPLDSYADFLASPDALQELDVLRYITAQFPPCFVMTSNMDFLRHEPDKLLPVLEKCGVPHVYRFCGGEDEQLWHVFHCDIRTDAAKRLNSEECDFFRSLL